MRLRYLVLILLPLAGCAGPPASAPTDSSPLVRAALAEWEAWGRVTVTGWPAARPADTAATPERFARLLEYWAAVPDGGWVTDRLQALRSGMAALASPDVAGSPGMGLTGIGTVTASGTEDIALYSRPAWSAAFISAVARWAGIPQSGLPSSSRHASYIDAVLLQALSNPGGAYFLPYAPQERAPRPGDLLCADRSVLPLMHWSERLAEIGQPRPMHCDVVVRTAPGVIEAVGGNVEDLVVLRRLPSDAEGRVLPAPWGEASFVLVLAARGNVTQAPPDPT